MRSRFPSPSSVMQPEDVLLEEWYSIPLETIRTLYESIPRRIQAVLKENGIRLHINKEMCVLHNCFHYFVYPPWFIFYFGACYIVQKIKQMSLIKY
jgi:hypothetical protein